MRAILYSLTLSLGLSACTSMVPSKIYGDWELESLRGLEHAYEAEEKRIADLGDTLLWDTENAHRGLRLSYDFLLLTKETRIILHGCNSTMSLYSGVIRMSFKDITLKEIVPPTLLSCTSKVKDASGEIAPRGPAPIEVVTSVYGAVSKDIQNFRLSENNQILIFEDENKNELARFKRKEST